MEIFLWVSLDPIKCSILVDTEHSDTCPLIGYQESVHLVWVAFDVSDSDASLSSLRENGFYRN
jgi:hypothetical protein